jgi:hypothetical protein
MDQYTISRDQSAVIDRPVLIFGEDDMLCAPAIRTIEDAGLRLGGRVPVGAARERLALQGTAAALWIELPHELDDEGSALLAQVDQDVSEGRYAAIVSTTPELIDPIVAKIKDPRIEIIVNADEAQRAAALAVGLASLEGTRRVADVASDKGAERLRQLSEEVNRIAATLARLSTGPSPTAAPTSSPALEEAPHVAADTVRSVIRARRLRSRYFPEELFADPAWDMLLDLLQAEIAQLRVPVSSLCIAAAVPATTALRWLKTMVQEGVFVRRADPHDGRRVFVELSPQASQGLRRYFAEVGKVAVI